MPGNPLTDPNWAPNLADTIERFVGTLRDKTTKPLLTVVRAVIFGVIAAFGGAIALVLVMVAFFRGVQALLDIGLQHHDSVWVSYIAFGTLFTLVGLVLLKKRLTVPDEQRS
jgi:hypothetical protein